jgi:hypothetical protein
MAPWLPLIAALLAATSAVGGAVPERGETPAPNRSADCARASQPLSTRAATLAAKRTLLATKTLVTWSVRAAVWAAEAQHSVEDAYARLACDYFNAWSHCSEEGLRAR